jgi:hypothetical protein
MSAAARQRLNSPPCCGWKWRLVAAGLGNPGFRLFHAQEASLMVLVWHLGAVFVPTGLAAQAGRYLLDWRTIIGSTRKTARIP